MRSMQALIQGLFLHIAETVFEKTEFEWMGNTIQLQLPWREVTYHDLIREHLGADWFEPMKKSMRAMAEKERLD